MGEVIQINREEHFGNLLSGHVMTKIVNEAAQFTCYLNYTFKYLCTTFWLSYLYLVISYEEQVVLWWVHWTRWNIYKKCRKCAHSPSGQELHSSLSCTSIPIFEKFFLFPCVSFFPQLPHHYAGCVKMLYKKIQGEFLADFMLETILGKKASYYEERKFWFIHLPL